MVIFFYALAETALNVAMPVYFVVTLDLPGWVPGTVFVINTVMIGIGQGLVVRAMTGRTRRRVLHTAIVFTVVSFVMLYAAGALTVATGVVESVETTKMSDAASTSSTVSASFQSALTTLLICLMKSLRRFGVRPHTTTCSIGQASSTAST